MTLDKWIHVINDGDVEINFKVNSSEVVTLKYTQLFMDSENKVTEIHLFVDELESIVKESRIILND